MYHYGLSLLRPLITEKQWPCRKGPTLEDPNFKVVLDEACKLHNIALVSNIVMVSGHLFDLMHLQSTAIPTKTAMKTAKIIANCHQDKSGRMWSSSSGVAF